MASRGATRFPERFKRERAVLIAAIAGIAGETDRARYASLMLHRLMVVYFLQRRGFVAGDHDYLRNRLVREQEERGRDQYYRHFLLPLFHDGLDTRARPPEVAAALGNVPYVGGALFAPHEIEQTNPGISIPDTAFTHLFDFFDAYQWRLDEAALPDEPGLTPDVLGHVFEQYLDQKPMGAYYTTADVTRYMAKNTIIPFLFSQVLNAGAVAFGPDGAVWRLAQADPDRYIHPAVRHGAALPLPPEIAAGMDDVARRVHWNQLAPAAYALPGETWRDVVARCRRYVNIRRRLTAGEVRNIHDFTTGNLDIAQFARDAIETCAVADLLAFYHALTRVTVLDPMCGAGAFLLAALDILAPLYEACLGRLGTPPPDPLPTAVARGNYRPTESDMMWRMVRHLSLSPPGHMEHGSPSPPQWGGGQGVGCPGDPHTSMNWDAYPSQRSFVLASIIAHNLHGVDIMAQAVEMTRLRLFLKLAAQVAPDTSPQRGLEPLSDVIFNLRIGNALVGFATRAEAERAAQAGGEPQFPGAGPFHWFTEFPGVMERSGFDVILGNPPYLETKDEAYAALGYAAAGSHAVHALCVERSLTLLSGDGCLSLIVPMALVSTRRMQVVRRLLERRRTVWYGNYAWRPGKLFARANRAITIVVAAPSERERVFSTTYRKWTAENRDRLMSEVAYVEIPPRPAFWVPKLGAELERSLLEKMRGAGTVLGRFMAASNHRVYYRTTGGLYWKVFTDFPPSFSRDGEAGHSTRETWFTVAEAALVAPVIALLSSSTFWWWYTITTTCRDLNPSDLRGFPVPPKAPRDARLAALGRRYLDDIRANSAPRVRRQQQTGRTETQSFNIHASKPIIDDIDRLLAGHYGFTPEELDFIINYDITHRLGRDAAGDGA